MFGIARRKERLGLQKVKLLFSIYVIDLVVPSTSFAKEAEAAVNSGIEETPLVLSVCFERGSKISSSKGKTYDRTNFDDERTKEEVLLTFNETLELCATLYKDPRTGKFQEKQGKILVRKSKNNKAVKIETFKGVGLHILKLHELASDLGFEQMKAKELLLPLELLANSTLRVIVTTRLVGTDRPADDTVSESSDYSDASDASMIGASFSFDSETLFGSSPSAFLNEHPGKSSKSRRGSAASSSYQATDDDDDEPLILNNLDEDFQSTKDVSLSLKHRESLRYSQRRNTSEAAANEQSAAGKLQKEMLTRQEERIKQNEETFGLYQKELETRALRIKRLEMQLSIQSDKMVTLKKEMISLKAEVKASKEAAVVAPTFDPTASPGESAVESMQSPASPASTIGGSVTPTETGPSTVAGVSSLPSPPTPTPTKAAPSARNSGNFLTISKRFFSPSTGGGVTEESNKGHSQQEKEEKESREELLKLLEQSNEETQTAMMTQMAIARELDTTLADLSLMTENMMQYKEQAEETLREKDEETVAAQQAAAEAVRANMKRAELDGEIQALVDELVSSKMNFANAATEVDAEKKKNCMLKRRVQYYAEKVAQLEIQCMVTVEERRNISEASTSSTTPKSPSNSPSPLPGAHSTSPSAELFSVRTWKKRDLSQPLIPDKKTEDFDKNKDKDKGIRETSSPSSHLTPKDGSIIAGICDKKFVVSDKGSVIDATDLASL